MSTKKVVGILATVFILLVMVLGGITVPWDKLLDPVTVSADSAMPVKALPPWAESGKPSRLLGQTPHCVLVGALDHEYIVCGSGEVITGYKSPVHIQLKFPNKPEALVETTREPRHGEPALPQATSAPPTEVVTDVPSTPQPPPVETSDPPCNRNCPPPSTPDPPSPPPDRHQGCPNNEHGNNGHGNDRDHNDSSNPGHHDSDDTDDDGPAPGNHNNDDNGWPGNRGHNH